MIQGVAEFVKTREARKLFRNKAAMVALVVICLYLLLAVAVMCGAIATSKLLRMTQTALTQEDPKEGLAAIRFGRITVADLPVSEIQALVDQAVVIKDELNQSENLDEDPAMLPKTK